MKIIYDNVLLGYDSITSDNESINYPAVNIADEILEKRYQFTYGSSDQITIELEESEYINSIFFAFTNATQLDFKLYDVYDTLLASHSFTSITANCDAYHFTSRYFVKKIIIDVTAVSGGYLGGVAAGEYYDLGSPTSPWEEGFVDNSVVESSPYGQSSQSYVEPIPENTWLFREYTREKINELKAIYQSLGVGFKIWVDPFEDSIDFIDPFYARITAPIRPQKNGRRYDFEFSVSEAR